MKALPRFNSASEDSGGTINFKLTVPASTDGASGTASASFDAMDREPLDPARHAFAAPPRMSSDWIPKDTFDCAPVHGSSHSRDPAVDPELAAILSPSVSAAGPLSRQMSMASARSSVALTAIESTAEVSKAVSRMSILSNERLPLLPDHGRACVAQEAAALRDSLAAERPQQGVASGLGSPESPEVKAAKRGRLGSSEQCLADIAEALAGTTGSPPWFSPELARQPRSAIGVNAYTSLLRAVLTAWQQEPNASEGLLQRLHFAEYLRDILQVPEARHSEALDAALKANAAMHSTLQKRLIALEEAEQLLDVEVAGAHNSTPPTPTAASGRLMDAGIFDKSHFLTDEAFRDYLASQLRNTRAAKLVVESMPRFAAVLRMEGLSLKGLGRKGKGKGKQKAKKGGGLLSCCFNPKLATEDEEFGSALFLKMWISVGGQSDKEKAIYTTSADAQSLQGSKKQTTWPDGPLEFCAASEAATVCIELRNMVDVPPDARSTFGKPGAGYKFDRRGSVSVRVSDLLKAGAGKHRCTVSLFALPPVAVAAGASAPLDAAVNPHISLTIDDADHEATHLQPQPTSTDSPNGDIIGTLTFIYDLVLDVRNLPEGTESPAAEPASPETEVAEPSPHEDVAHAAPPAPPLAGTEGPGWGTLQASSPPATTDDVVLAVESHEDDVKPADDDSDDLSFCSEHSKGDVVGVGMATGSPEGDTNGCISGGGSPMLSRRKYKQESLLGASGSPWTTPKANTPRITRAKSSNFRSHAHPFATSRAAASLPGDHQVQPWESPGHKSQKSFSKYLPKRGNANQSDNRQLEGKHGSSAVFVEAFTCLWALWREKVEAGTVTELARVTLPQACIPEWLDVDAVKNSRVSESGAPESPTHAVPVPNLHSLTRGLSQEEAKSHLPPQWILSLLAAVASNLQIRAEEALLLALTALSSTPQLSSTAPTFPSRLHALQLALMPLAAAALSSQLTHGEAGAFARGMSPLIAESAWALDRMHIVLLTLHDSDVLVQLIRMTAAAIVYCPEPSRVAPLILPHFKEAVARRMVAHHMLTEVKTQYDAIPVLIEAMRTCINDFKLEAEKIPPSLAKDVAILPVSASYRYGMIVSAVQRLWKSDASGALSHRSPRNPITPSSTQAPAQERAVLYDALVQQMEDTFQELHLLMLDLGITELLEEDKPAVKATGTLTGSTSIKRNGAAVEPGSVVFLPCKGVKLLDLTVLLQPMISAWMSAVGIKLESYAATAVAQDSQGPKSWAPVARLSGVRSSASVLDLFYVIINGVDKVAARLIVKREPNSALDSAEALAAAVGGAIRWYAGAVEAAALADLQQVALAAHTARTLPPAGRALLTAHIQEESPSAGTTFRAASNQSPSSSSPGSSWPPLIKREFAVKLNNLQDTTAKTEIVARKIAQHLPLAEDPLYAKRRQPRSTIQASQGRPSGAANGNALHDPIRSVSPEPGAVGTCRRRGSRASGDVAGRASMEQLAVAAEMGRASASLQSELSFMSSALLPPSAAESIEESELPVCTPTLPSFESGIFTKVEHVFVEVMQYIFRCKLAVLAAIRHSFCGILTLEIAKVLTPAAPTKQNRLGFSTLARTFASMPSSSTSASTAAQQVVAEVGASDSATRASHSMMASVPEASTLAPEPTESPKINMNRNPMLPASNRGPKDTAGSQQIRQASKEGLLDSAALGGLLEIIDREFQVMKECMVPQIFDEVLLALWRATCEVLEGFLLASLPSQNPLTPPQVNVLESLLTFLKDYFHAEGAGIPMTRLDNTATRAERLFQLFAAPTEALGAHWEVLLEDNAARNAQQETPRSQETPRQSAPVPTSGSFRESEDRGMGSSLRRAADVTQVDLLRLLRQRQGDAKAKQLLQTMLEHTEKYAMQILFDLPESEQIIARSDCTLMGHQVAGTLFLSTSYICFSSMAPAAAQASQTSLQRLSTASARAFGASTQQNPAVMMTIPLTQVTTMSDAFIGRHRALVFTLLDKTQVEFAKFLSSEGHSEFQQEVRLHVVGTGSTLDRTLRGVENAAAPAWLKLPPGEHVERSYACALYNLIGKYRGSLHVCREILLFVGYENKYRTTVRFENVLSVELAKGHWLRGVYVVVTCSRHPHKLEFCELAEAHAEEMVAEILDCIARHR